ncbi:MAG: GTPase HflX, partial [Acidimicrobiales bacterium]|nr:GTPase HflX [Acidimicrobiales bacterium]
ELVVPFARGDVLAALHRDGQVLSEVAGEDAMVVRARLDDAVASRWSEFVVDDGATTPARSVAAEVAR